MAALKYWVWLSTAKGLSNHSRWLLLEHFSSPEDIYYAEPEQLRLVEGLTASQLEALENKSLDRAQQILETCAEKEIFVLTAQDAAYPNRLRSIYDAPILLYGRGAMPLFDDEATIAMVGTRSCTPYGIQAAEQLGYELGRQGAIVVSGLAKGIDAAAHRGALRGGGFVAGVLGCGVDVIYPESSRRLYEDVAATGVLLSEYPSGTPPERSHFPERNRIISGLSLGVVVVEAPERSGALITANMALEQGRDVFAVPGPIYADSSRGCNQLIREGAGLVMDGWDVLEGYQSRFPHRLHCDKTRLPKLPEDGRGAEQEQPARPVEEEKLPVLDLRKDTAGLTDDQIRILRILNAQEGKLTDDVAVETDLPVRRVLSALTVLEIDGYIRQQSARRFVRTVELNEIEKEG